MKINSRIDCVTSSMRKKTTGHLKSRGRSLTSVNEGKIDSFDEDTPKI